MAGWAECHACWQGHAVWIQAEEIDLGWIAASGQNRLGERLADISRDGLWINARRGKRVVIANSRNAHGRVGFVANGRRCADRADVYGSGDNVNLAVAVEVGHGQAVNGPLEFDVKTIGGIGIGDVVLLCAKLAGAIASQNAIQRGLI